MVQLVEKDISTMSIRHYLKSTVHEQGEKKKAAVQGRFVKVRNRVFMEEGVYIVPPSAP